MTCFEMSCIEPFSYSVNKNKALVVYHILLYDTYIVSLSYEKYVCINIYYEKLIISKQYFQRGSL